jgi:hypothetical protein
MNPNALLKKGLGIASGVAGQAQRLAGPAQGIVNRVKPGGKKELPDVATTRKVESIVFRDARFPKDQISVNTADGVVYLRGTLKQAAAIKALEAAVRAIPEVKDVENLVTQPKTASKQPTGRFKKASEKPVRRGKITADRTDDLAKGEDTPKAKAARREGRSAAPLGSRGEAGPAGTAKAAKPTTPAKPKPAATAPSGPGVGTTGATSRPGETPTKSGTAQPSETDQAETGTGQPDKAGSLPTPTV